MMAAAVLAVHLAQLQVIALPGGLGIQVALDLVLFTMAVIGGRVIPMFIDTGVPGAESTYAVTDEIDLHERPRVTPRRPPSIGRPSVVAPA